MQPYTVHTKLVISGRYVEQYDFEKSYIVGMPRISNSKTNIVKSRPEQEKIREDNVKRTRKNIRRLINANQDLTKFMTLTFNTPVLDLSEANLIFRNFIKRLNRKFSDFKYLCVPEFQPTSKRVHYHLLCNLPYIDNQELVEFWGQGFVFIRKIYNIDNVGAYICKYLTKESFDKRYFRHRKFFYSFNLLRPFVVDQLNQVKKILNNVISGLGVFSSKLFEFTAYTKYLGKLDYKQYKVHNFISLSPD